MNILLIILAVLLILIAVAIVLLVLFQDTNDRGMGTLAGSSNDSFYNSNKGRTKDVLMRKLTIGLGIAYVAIVIVIGKIMG